jgi:ketosteroid isomerase-like protein
MTPTTPAIEELLDHRIEACRDKSIDRLMALYSTDIVYFDVVPPHRFSGQEAVRRNFERWFGEYEGPIGLETHELSLAIDEDVAFAHMLHRDRGNAGLPEGQEFWLRSTVCCRRRDERWLITHEHISVPVDYKSGKPVMDIR